jgi:hypothetical protein
MCGLLLFSNLCSFVFNSRETISKGKKDEKKCCILNDKSNKSKITGTFDSDISESNNWFIRLYHSEVQLFMPTSFHLLISLKKREIEQLKQNMKQDSRYVPLKIICRILCHYLGGTTNLLNLIKRRSINFFLIRPLLVSVCGNS